MRHVRRGGRLGLPILGALIVVAWIGSAKAQVGSQRYASFVMDAASGQVLSAANADEPRYPASLTKMMTIYMLFEAIRDRRVTLDEMVPVSAHSASMPPSKLGLLPGTTLTVEQALLGLVTKSANDAAAALGELLGGDEERFAQMMTLRARALGMSRTTFRNASGWPDPDQITTARDLALLARHLIQDYPDEYHYFSAPSFMFHGRMIPNHDRMLQTYPGADGLKTGYIDASGCNLVTSAVRGEVRLIGVVMGASNGYERDTHMASLLDAGFDHMGVPISPRVPARPHMPALIAAASAATLPPASLPAPQLDWRFQRHGVFRGTPVRLANRQAFEEVAEPRGGRFAERRPDYRYEARPEIRMAPVAARGRTRAEPQREPQPPHQWLRPSAYGHSASVGLSGRTHG